MIAFFLPIVTSILLTLGYSISATRIGVSAKKIPRNSGEKLYFSNIIRTSFYTPFTFLISFVDFFLFFHRFNLIRMIFLALSQLLLSFILIAFALLILSVNNNENELKSANSTHKLDNMDNGDLLQSPLDLKTHSPLNDSISDLYGECFHIQPISNIERPIVSVV